ncbi:MAG TPA: glycosyltransferase family 2 protein [Candidatus Dormibacteraeota bacterium]|nr:glycosyltransferase family 2 protein [Candidatus Dormibacteraeota bacterium]
MKFEKASTMHNSEKMEMPAMGVSIVVPCRNEIRHIRDFLESVLRQDVAGMNVEVLIADGGSTDRTRQVLDRFERWSKQNRVALRVIDNPGKIVSTGLNAAIRAASGEFIIRMDVHTRYAPDYVQNCIKILRETDADNVGGPALTRAEGYMAQAIAHAYHAWFASGGAKFHNARYEGPVDTVPYGCWKKSTLERVGLFDEKLVRSQDAELNLRIASSGGKIWQSPKITSWYSPRKSLRALFCQHFQYGYWKVSVIRKHRKPASLRSLAPGICLLAALLLLVFAAAANLGGFAWWRHLFLSSLAILAGSYFAASFFASIQAANEYGGEFLPVFPIVFATYHLSYGLGFLLAVSCRPATRDRFTSIQKVVSAMTNE